VRPASDQSHGPHRGNFTIACETYCDASFGEITVKMLATIIVAMGLAQTLGNQAK
jgi:hypothetical protein